MAVVWAKQAGSWTDTTLWAFWNENTQQIEDYGQVPQVDDVVYCNGYVIDIPNGYTTINVGKLLNLPNPHTSNTGGSIRLYTSQYGATRYTIIADIEMWESSTTTLFTKTQVASCVQPIVNGNIINNNKVYGIFPLGGQTFATINEYIINGNVFGTIASAYNNFGYFIDLKINGNVTCEDCNLIKFWTSSVSNTYSTEIIIIGNSTFDSNITSGYTNNPLTAYFGGNVEISATPFLNRQNLNTEAEVFGNWTYHGNALTTFDRFTIHGNIYYDSEYIGVSAPVIVLSNNDFKWLYVGPEPNPNPFIIVNPNTIADTYPTEDKVLAPTQYGAQMELVGRYTPDYPPESVVLKDYEYGDSDARKTGTMVQEVNVEVGCVTKEDVREGVELIGMGEVGTLVVPSVDDVREGVVFDNGSVGTLIVQGGGDRLRIADFGYYTRSTSITYIVDLTESDKPAFADCEEIVLRSLFPTLDLDNIPDKFFDDLFVQFLRYRLLVEYYRGTSINSKFTPSEPAAEIVNYANTKCEYWLNTANLFLQLWGEKYPNSVKRDRIIL